MFIDCTECSTHVFSHVSDRFLATFDLSQAVFCDNCLAEREGN